ncbi:cystine ABC transporter permease [Kiloniella laminariae]|uniref:Cystine ABC transporter permease n=1 Tax=Kiloniella laminariae TaxID=454162 RepID=A0ABT4LRG9_9PROT|nr:cystine ABC transporter permease [Kiloniella laminariae]MCZ4282537.1 cystine ABC transporter permease [Kiloniella laminariae]
MDEITKLILDSVPFLAKGTAYTLGLSLGSMTLGLALGFAVAFMRLSPLRLFNWPAKFFISFIRGTPLIVQLFLIYYGLPEFGIRLDPIPAALLGLSLNVGGYTGEILRGAIGAIERSHWEAAYSIGMTPFQAMRRSILPQAIRIALPSLGNTFLSLLKDTAIAATIQVPELFRQAQLISARTYEIFAMYISAAVIYWIFSTGLSWLQNRLEKRANRHLRAA